MNDYEFWDELGKIFNAVVSYQEKAVEFNKRFINPWIRLGNVFDKQDRNQEAICAYEKALELDPANAQNWYELGNIHFRDKNYDKAVETYNKAIELAPQSGWSYNNLALTLVSQGKYAEALPLYQKGVDLMEDDKDKAIVWNRIGNVYRKLNQYDLAVQSFQRADELDAENAGFRDELDDVPESTAPVQSNTKPDQESKSSENPGPIELIVSESGGEDETLLATDVPADSVAESRGEDETLLATNVPTDSVSESGGEDETFPATDVPADSVAMPETISTQAPSSDPATQTDEQSPLVSTIAENESDGVNLTDNVNVPGEDLPSDPAKHEASGAEQVTTAVTKEVGETYTEIPLTVNVTTTETAEGLVANEQIDNGTAVQPEEILGGNGSQVPSVETVQASTPSVDETNMDAPEDTDVVADQQNVKEVTAESPLVKVEIETDTSVEISDSSVVDQLAYEEFLKDNESHVAPVDEQPEDSMPEALQEPVTFVDPSGELQIEMDTKNAHVWNELGNIYFTNGAYDDAVVAYSKAIQLDRWFAWPYSNLALTYVQKSRFTEAILLYQRSIELFTSEKDKAISWNRLGNVYRRLNNYDGAISSYQRADELDPENTTLSLQSRFSLLGNYSMEQTPSQTLPAEG